MPEGVDCEQEWESLAAHLYLALVTCSSQHELSYKIAHIQSIKQVKAFYILADHAIELYILLFNNILFALKLLLTKAIFICVYTNKISMHFNKYKLL